MKLHRPKVRISSLLLLILATVLWSEFFLSLRNVLAYKKDWTHGLTGSVNPGVNLVPTLIFPTLTQGFRLRSNEIHGLQRIFSHKEIAPKKIQAWFKTGEDSYIDLIFNANDQGFKAVRLSTSKLRPSGVYQSENSGKLRWFKPISIELKKGFNEVSINSNKMILSGRSYLLPVSINEMGKVGFQISYRDIELMNFRASDTKEALQLNFLPNEERFSLYLQNYLALLLITLLVSALWPRIVWESTLFITGLGFLTLIAGFVGVFKEESIQSATTRLQRLELWWSSGDKIERILEGLHQNKFYPDPILCKSSGCSFLKEDERFLEKKDKRLLIFSGSTFQPALVKNLNESFFFRFDALLRDHKPNQENYLLHSKGDFRNRIKEYEDLIEKIKPDEMIIETLAFDNEVSVITDFIQRWQERGVRVILLRRAQNIENFKSADARRFIDEIKLGMDSHASGLFDYQWTELVRTIGHFRDSQKKLNFEFYDPNELILQDEIIDGGQVFWDGFHFTAWGQEIMAQWLADKYLASSKD